MKNRHVSYSQEAFTLIEVLVVVAIIAVLASLIAGVAGHATQKSDNSKAKADLQKIKNALEEYRIEYGQYPVNDDPEDSKALSSALWVKPQAEGRKPFLVMKGWDDPMVEYTIKNPWDEEYRYLHRANKPYAIHNDARFGYDLWSVGADNNSNLNNWASSP